MDKRKREILALGLLVLLGICVAAGMMWYIMVGHNWNKAASHIDDLVGSMDGYTVVVYEGTLPASKSTSGKRKHVKIEKVIESYREKGASVVTLHLDDLARYDDPIVVSRGSRRFGICACPGKYRYVVVRDKVADLTKHGADFTMVLANKPDIKKGWLRHVDMVVLACDGHIGDGGQFIGQAFFVDAVRKGSVQAVIISPSGTVTAKTITAF